MTREEVAEVLSLLDGTAQLVAKLRYGSGLCIMEAVRLRVKDIDFQMKQLTVRSGKGDTDRCATFPATLTPLLQNPLAGVKTLHQQDVAQGHDAISLPHALTRQSPQTATVWGWQSVFPAQNLSVDPRAASPVAIIWTPASSTRPSRWQRAGLRVGLRGCRGEAGSWAPMPPVLERALKLLQRCRVPAGESLQLALRERLQETRALRCQCL